MVKGIMDPTKTLIDSGSSKNFIDINFARAKNLKLEPLAHPRSVIAIDGKELPRKIRYKVKQEINIEGWTFEITLYAMELGDTPIILGLDWLQQADPDIDWKTMELSWDKKPEMAKAGTTNKEELDLSKYPRYLHETLLKHQTVFSEELFKKLPEHRPYDCDINFKEGAELPTPAKIYPLSPIESIAVKAFIDQELADGKIRPSKSEIASPCFFVKKKYGSLRLVTDFRKINEITIPNRFPIPLQIELIDKVKGKKLFSKLDLRWGYNNIRIKEGHEWKTSFRTKYGVYEYLVMPFGLKNAPGIFQEFMNWIFRDLLDIYVVVYLDDILIFSDNEEDHTRHVEEVLKRLMENNLFAKLTKCEFAKTEVGFLGLIISTEGISMEKEKIKAIQEWAQPTTVKQLQAFLGFVNFYRRFIKDFSLIARVLHELTQKGVAYNWTTDCEAAFQKIKEAVSQDPVLIHPNPDKPFILETDASGVAIGSILSQRHWDGYLHPVAYMSKSYNNAQRNYDTANKELLSNSRIAKTLAYVFGRNNRSGRSLHRPQKPGEMEGGRNLQSKTRQVAYRISLLQLQYSLSPREDVNKARRLIKKTRSQRYAKSKTSNDCRRTICRIQSGYTTRYHYFYPRRATRRRILTNTHL